MKTKNKNISNEEMVRLAKIGLIALIDEATGYQKERFKEKKALRKMYNKDKGGK